MIETKKTRKCEDGSKEIMVSGLKEIMVSINKLLDLSKIENYAKFIRAIQVNFMANYTIWMNETKARQGQGTQDHLLPLTHSVNGLRMRAGNMIIAQTGGRKDLNLDRLNDELCKKFGYDFSEVTE